MHAGIVFPACSLIIVVLWRNVQAVSPVPTVPDRVRALVGSCVVIPCSFTPAAPRLLRGQRQRVDVRLRFKDAGQLFSLPSIAFNSESKNQVSRVFQGRTSLTGQTGEGDCSVKIERVRRDDPPLLEVALKKGDDLLWGRSRSISVDITDTPEPPVISGELTATEGQLVTLNCSVTYHCPSAPPSLQWSWERGAQLNNTELRELQTLYPDPHRWMLLSSLSFTVSHQVKPRLRCEVKHPGAKTSATARDLHVTFAPKDVRVQVETMMVQQGGSALLVCLCKADPPVSEYRWSYTQHGHTVHLHRRTHTVRVFNVTRDMRVRCSAQNAIGRGESQPTSLNVQYKPSILLRSSTCAVKDSQVLCHCSVDSNPRAAVTWSVNGTVPPPDYNVSVTSDSDPLTASLRGLMDKPLRVTCFAFNFLGNDSLVLLQGEEETAPLIWIILPAVVVCLLILLLLPLIHLCRRKTEKRVLRGRPVVYPEGLGIYQDRTPLYVNCTEVTHVYTNGSYQLVYQNCTPLFVHTKQRRPMSRRGGERRRDREVGGIDRRAEVRGTRVVQESAAADPESAIYLEIL